MRRQKDYLENAEDCRELARVMPDAHRAQLLDMARQWEQLERANALRDGTAGSEPGHLRI